MKYAEWMRLAATERERTLALVESLDEMDWKKPTDCTAWDVRELVAHLVGIAEMQASQREMRRQLKLGKKVAHGRPAIDGATEVQVRERADATPAQLVADLHDATARGLRARGRVPAPVRILPIPFGPPLGVRPMGYLTGCIFTRDAWMHRVDLCRATGVELELTPDHDGAVIADVVAEWARTHGRPYVLELTGPAGGTFSSGTGGETSTMDAVEFARVLSGRATGAGLIATSVPF